LIKKIDPLIKNNTWTEKEKSWIETENKFSLVQNGMTLLGT